MARMVNTDSLETVQFSVWSSCCRRVVVIFGLVIALFWAKPVEARVTIAEIAGMPVNCTDFRGRAVVNMSISRLGDVGFARVINTVPYILVDPEIMRTLPKKLQLFFYSHECAHHVLGHWFNPTRESEREADCWAVQKHRDNGDFSRQDVVNFAPWLRKSRGSSWGHLPGPERAAYLLACFDKT
ncbi:MAG: hypothetical protein AAFV45_01115 [Pseudomonadota bacterium]